MSLSWQRTQLQQINYSYILLAYFKLHVYLKLYIDLAVSALCVNYLILNVSRYRVCPFICYQFSINDFGNMRNNFQMYSVHTIILSQVIVFGTNYKTLLAISIYFSFTTNRETQRQESRSDRHTHTLPNTHTHAHHTHAHARTHTLTLVISHRSV